VTSIETGPSWSERVNPRNWTLAWKLVIVGLVPALLALALGVLRIADQAGSAAELCRSTRVLEVSTQVAAAADALRQERNVATLFVAGNRAGERAPLATVNGQTDAAVTTALTAVESSSDIQNTAASTALRARAGIEQLAALRNDVTGATAFVTVRDRYTTIIGTLDVLDRALLRQVSTPESAGRIDALTATGTADEQLALEHTILGADIRAGQLQPDDKNRVNAADNAIYAAHALYQEALSPAQFAQFGNFLANDTNGPRAQVALAIAGTPADRPITIPPAQWDNAYQASKNAIDRSGSAIRLDLVATSTAAEATASNLAGINSVLLMLGLLIGITVAILVARSLIRSLRVLRTAALDVAERRLPQAVESMRAGETPDVTVDPVPLNTRDEVGQVARAFDAVHGQAVRLAADQAALQSNVSAMFVNLSRRSQALVERQLQLIEQLESNEQDADQLSNLFQLDHLATRMRRNSENLLVLAGTDLAKRNIAPVPMVDVLRAAVSEIEQYQRIVVQAPPTATIVGRAASDLVHLLAELLDNATNFSPPDSQVVMSTTRTSDGSIVVEIADRGVGMIEHELSDANQRLGGPSTVDVSASRRMGLFVVGRLGTRHGIGVRLSTSSSGAAAGLTASVTVPAFLVPATEPVEAGRPIGVPQPAGVPAQGGRGDVPAQRAGANGAGRPGSLSALVAGTDGPANPTGVIDGPASDGPLLAAPPANGSANGSSTASGLPSRRPGSTLRPDGPPKPPDLPERPAASGGGEPADDRSAVDENDARKVAEQARRDQEAAAQRAAQSRAAQQERDATDDGGRGDPQPPVTFTKSPDSAPAADEPSTVTGQRPEADAERSDVDAEPDTVTPGPAPAARPSAASPPTTPLPVVRPAPRRPSPTPTRTDQQSGPRPAPQVAQPSEPPPSTDPLGLAAGPGRGPDELFAPRVPAIGDPAYDRSDAAQTGFDLAETTPIFEEIASAWFRSNRPVPVSWETDGESDPANRLGTAEQAPAAPPSPPPPAPAPTENPLPSRTAGSRPAPGPLDGPAPQPDQPAPPVAPERPAPQQPQPVAEHQPAPEHQLFPEPSFAGAADEGWRAASTIESDRADELTAAGLPKRRPRARLVPGSAGSAVLASPVPASRSAENIRGRLASYQQGVRQGRESRARGESGSVTDTDTSPASAGGNNGNNDEESS
jgi:signal transduction histidine kinase